MTATLSASQARRIALAAQGLAGPRPSGPVTGRAFRSLASRLGVIQLDSVNVFARAHYLPAFARLGVYDRELLDREAWGKRPSLFEYWGHVASLMPVEMQPLFRWRMDWARDLSRTTKGGLINFARARGDYIGEVLAEIERRGPVTGGDFAAEAPRKSGWWEWSEGKAALEWLFWAGLITVKTRRGFERVYDLTERVIPSVILNAPTPSKQDAQRELVRIAIRALGIADLSDVADYFRMYNADTKARLGELTDAGEVELVKVEGWPSRAYLAAGARLPRRATGASLLSPFDNLIWRRERTLRMFDAHYRIGIYTPAAQREHGYYVYLFLLGEKIAARVDLKSDRKSGILLVQAAHLEPGSDAGEVAPALSRELALAAEWQGLGEVAVAKKGDLSAALLREIG